MGVRRRRRGGCRSRGRNRRRRWGRDRRLPAKGHSNSHGARPVYYNHLNDYVDSEQ
jgi:hypothetical protein